ncbi:DUF3298 and DUF4163 domain-containing protein [[Clostridium] dakarense]|uniref:DUF3298 and DUF4163 domain-containing protein n=1 Tax=Faecalimicrobium dakarense TaxID=1301100 RepID=UPI0004B408EB|nr:DUF3298 and DUF4163 domain-containing protein [[Clostridium] dakarense]
MIENKKIEQLKNEYNNIEIPDRLEDIVNESLGKKVKNSFKWVYAAASVGIMVVSINLSPSFANTLEKVPVIGSLVKVVNLANYKIEDNGFEVSIKSPKIEGLKNKDLEYKLNKEFEKEGKTLYKDYLKEIEELKKDGIEGREMVDSWYDVKTDNDKILSLALYTHHAQGSSNTEGKYYTVDKENETVLTLEGMFSGSDYVNVISENIKDQMKDRMKQDKDKVYWIEDEMAENFNSITKDQKFYINKNNELVICFDKYEVAPGYMGMQEFVIPNEIVASLQNK